MFMSEPKTIYDAIKPLVYVNCFVGMGALRLPNISNTIYFFMKLQAVIVAVFNLSMIYITFNSVSQIIDFNNVSPMAFTMYKILFRANSCTTMFAPVLLWLHRKVLTDCLRQMEMLNDTFKSVFGAQNDYKKQYVRLCYQIGAILLIMFSVGICDTVLSMGVRMQMNIRSVFVFCSVAQTLHHPILVMLLLDVNFCTFVGYLGKKFRDMNSTLLKLAGKSSIFCPGEKLFTISRRVGKTATRNRVQNREAENLINDRHYLLREIRKVHLELCKLSRKTNLAFGIQNLLSTGISFVMITGLLYTIYSAFSRQNFTNNQLSEVIGSLTWTAIYVFKIWLVNHSCWSVTNEAARTGEVIYEFFTSSVDKELEHEIHEFGVQMLQNPVRFDACGFFTLHYTFVQGMIGSITTHLVILIQMSQVPEISTFNSTLASNSTGISAN